MTRITKVTMPLTPHCTKGICKKGLKITTLNDMRSSKRGQLTTYVYPVHTPKCWSKQKDADLFGIICKAQKASPFLSNVLSTIADKAPMEEHDFDRFLFNIVNPLHTSDKNATNRLSCNLEKTSSANTEMGANLLLEWGLATFLKKGPRSLKEMNIVHVAPRNLDTYKNWARKHSFSHLIADLEKGIFYSSTAHLEYHADLITSIMLTGINVLEGVGKAAHLSERYVALSFMAEDENGIVSAVARSSLNYKRMKLTKTQTRQLLTILQMLKTNIDTSFIR